MAYRFAAERGDLLAAVAPLAASIGGRSSDEAPEWHVPEPVRPLPVIAFHGRDDNDIRYEGGRSEHRGGTRTYWPVERSIRFWVRNNECAGRVVDQYLNEKRVQLRSWGGCKNEADVSLYRINGWGHVWPGKYFTSDLAPDDSLRNFDAAEIIWNFFSVHRRRP